VPVNNLTKLLAVAEPFIGKPEQLSSGVLKFQPKEDDEPFYVKDRGAWAYVSNQPGPLASVPADPTSLLGGLNKTYDLALRINVANVPDGMRKQFIAKMESDAEQDMSRQPGEDETEHFVRKTVIEEVVKAVTRAANELSEVTVGWALDHDVERTFIDLAVTAKPGTKLAGEMNRLGKERTRFAGFTVPGAAVSTTWTGQLADVEKAIIESVSQAVEEKIFKDIDNEDSEPREKEYAKKLVGNVIDVVRGTASAGRADGALSMVLRSDAMTIVGGTYVSDGQKADEIAKQLAQLAAIENPGLAFFVRLDADQHEGVRMHTISLPIDEDEENREQLMRLVGEKINIVLGMGKESIYFAAGKDAMKTLKQAISKSAEAAAAPPLDAQIALRATAEFLAEVADTQKERKDFARIAEALSGAEGKDHIRLKANPIRNGVQLRLELEEGVVRLLGKASQWKDEE